MANRTIFANRNQVAAPNTVNAAGGASFALPAKEALAQYAVTSCFSNTYYAGAEEQVDKVLELCAQANDPVFVAKLAVYARTVAKMKDTPVVLLAWLAANGHTDVVRSAFPLVCNNFKQVANFAQVIRSGKVGRKSFGTVLKKLINEYLTGTDADKLFTSTVGVGNPSIADVLKMTHPKGDAKHNALFGYFLDKKYNKRYLPQLVKEFEAYKAKPEGDAPEVPFQLLTNLKLSTEQWTSIARNMPWNTLRMNLNSLQNKGVLGDEKVVRELADKLTDRKGILYSKAFPYSIMTAYLNTNGQVPARISNALQDALEIATENVPSLNGKVVVFVDVSGSMGSAVTGVRQGATSKVSCRQVAALVASVVLRKNPDAVVIPFDTQIRNVQLNGRDSIATNAVKLAINGGGTDVSCGLRELNRVSGAADAVIIISDNESWAGMNNTHEEWTSFKRRNRNAKLVLMDLQPNHYAPVGVQKDVLHVGGFSDEVFTVINRFLSGDNTNVVKTINEVSLDG